MMPEDRPKSLWPDPLILGAMTDLYQLTMMAGYDASSLGGTRATFELFVRRLPEGRSYLIFAGLEQAVADLVRLRFTREQADVLRTWPVFSGIDPEWFERLPEFRFRGNLWSVREGTVVFAGEPLVRVEAALPEAQWVETFLIASLAYPTLVASKAARMVRAAEGRTLFDFGTRRGHGPMAGLLAARASYLAGFAGTSNVQAAVELGIPATGTMAHSWVQAFPSEAEAFTAFSKRYPGGTLLVDTYDVLTGVQEAAGIDPPIGAIRIDSGDLLETSLEARRILDAADRSQVKIIGSGDLDEWKIAELIQKGARFDGFGVGTELITSRDAPALSMVYKLVELNGQGRVKLSPGKRSYPFAKQVHRLRDHDGRFCCDHVSKAGEVVGGEALLIEVLHEGQLTGAWPTLTSLRENCRQQFASLPDAFHALDAQAIYPLTYSDVLQNEAALLGVRSPEPSHLQS